VLIKPSNGDLLYSPDPIIVGAGISLDGESLVLPDGSVFAGSPSLVLTDGDDYGDEVSSMNSSLHGREFNDIKIVGTTPMSLDLSTTENSSSEGHLHVFEGTEGTANSQGCKSRSCFPVWIRTAPCWLKVILGGSLAFFISATLLVGLGVALSTDQDNDASQNVRIPTSFAAPTTPPALAPSPTIFGSQYDPTMDSSPQNDLTMDTSPQNDLTMDSSSQNDPTMDTSPQNDSTMDSSSQNDPTMDTSTAGQTDWTESMPSTPPTLPPTQVPSREPSALPSPTETQEVEVEVEVVTFFVTGGRDVDSERALTPERLGNLPQKMGSSFLLNIGDWNSPSLGCEEQAYEDVDTLFRNSSVPVYFVPGDNEYNGTLNGPQ
jgi:hypothetical protein